MTDRLYLTRTEMDALSTQLRSLGRICPALDDAIIRRARATEESDVKTTASDTRPLDFNDHASTIRTRLHDTLAEWVEHTCNYGSPRWPGRRTIVEYAAWLDHHLVDLALTPEAPRADKAIRAAIRRAVAAADRPPVSHFVGPCQSDLAGVRCDGVYVRPGTEEITCRGCGVQCDVQKILATTRAAVLGRSYPARELASAVSIVTETKVPFETIRTWIRRKKITPVSVTTGGEELFRLSDAIELWERMPTRQRGSA